MKDVEDIERLVREAIRPDRQQVMSCEPEGLEERMRRRGFLGRWTRRIIFHWTFWWPKFLFVLNQRVGLLGHYLRKIFRIEPRRVLVPLGPTQLIKAEVCDSSGNPTGEVETFEILSGPRIQENRFSLNLRLSVEDVESKWIKRKVRTLRIMLDKEEVCSIPLRDRVIEIDVDLGDVGVEITETKDLLPLVKAFVFVDGLR